MPKISRRTAELGTENAFVVLAEVNELIRQGKNIISFCIGQPDFHTPVNIQDAAVKAIREGRHGYTPSAGIPELRTAAAKDMGRLRGLSIDPEHLVIGAGAKPFIAYTILCTTDYGVGDEVIYPDRKSTRLNSSHLGISYAVFCLKKKTQTYYLGSMRIRHSEFRKPLVTYSRS